MSKKEIPPLPLFRNIPASIYYSLTFFPVLLKSFFVALYGALLYTPDRFVGFICVFIGSLLLLGILKLREHRALMKRNQQLSDYVGRDYEAISMTILRSADGKRQVRFFPFPSWWYSGITEYHYGESDYYEQLEPKEKLILGSYIAINKDKFDLVLPSTADSEVALPFFANKRPARQLWVALVKPKLLKVKFELGLPPELKESSKISKLKLATPCLLLVEQFRGEYYLLNRLTEDGQYVGDTWHASIEAAKQQAQFEYGQSLGEWRVVPRHVSEPINYALKPESGNEKKQELLSEDGMNRHVPISSMSFEASMDDYTKIFFWSFMYSFFLAPLGGLSYTPNRLAGWTIAFLISLLVSIGLNIKSLRSEIKRNKRFQSYVGPDWGVIDWYSLRSHDDRRQARVHTYERLGKPNDSLSPERYEELANQGKIVERSYILIPKEERINPFPFNLLMRFLSFPDGKTALQFDASKQPEQQLWVALIDEQHKTLKVNFYLALPPELRKSQKDTLPLKKPRMLLLEQKGYDYFLYRLTEKGHYVGDTWHLSIEQAKQQAEFEFGKALGEWRAVPEDVEDTLQFALSPTT